MNIRSSSAKKQPIEIVEYQPIWPEIFEQEAEKIRRALSSHIISIHHFGSTAVPGLASKPKIDILVVLSSFDAFDSSSLVEIGFEDRGTIIPTGRYFSKGSPKIHLHLFEQENPLIQKNLQFRDWLRTHEDDRKAYEHLKKELAQHHTDCMQYCHAKTTFIKRILQKCGSSH